jgi:hypothetical protein
MSTLQVGADINTLSSRRRPGFINTIYTIIFNIVFMGPGLRRGDNEGQYHPISDALGYPRACLLSTFRETPQRVFR